MKKQKKQNLLTFIIVILVIALAVLLGSMAYEEAINMNKNQTEQISSSKVENDGNEEINNEDEIQEDEQLVEEDVTENNDDTEVNDQENNDNLAEDEPEYVGEEETQSNAETDSGKTTEEKAIDLAKKEWGNDASVTFNIEEKKGNKYYVSVKRNAITACWYEVDIETWEISEY